MHLGPVSVAVSDGVALPRSMSGKILKRELGSELKGSERELAGRAPSSFGPI